MSCTKKEGASPSDTLLHTSIFSVKGIIEGVGPSTTFAWPGWKQPDIPVEVDTVQEWFCKMCIIMYRSNKQQHLGVTGIINNNKQQHLGALLMGNEENVQFTIFSTKSPLFLRMSHEKYKPFSIHTFNTIGTERHLLVLNLF